MMEFLCSKHERSIGYGSKGISISLMEWYLMGMLKDYLILELLLVKLIQCYCYTSKFKSKRLAVM
jgi:hypothetical protein